MRNFNINNFIKEKITGRVSGFFDEDIIANKELLSKEIKDKNVLVIGGGGTIGSNYIKAILPFKPRAVIIVDNNENGLTELVRDVRSTKDLFVPDIFVTYPVDFGNNIFSKIFNAYKPFDIVANFAAHKHVRSEKDVFSIESMIQNNLVYAHKLLQLIEENKPAHFFCVSTDKAANPVNIMGATKKLMEDLVMQYASSFKCTTARFANVAFSNGSLLDGFNKRLMNLQPLSVPKDVKRYFVSPQESGQICMMACMLGDSGDVFFPKLKEDQLTSFYDITVDYLNAMGYTMDECATEDEAKGKAALLNENSTSYPVYTFESNTSGEKLFEEFYTEIEDVDFNRYESLGVVKNDLTKLQTHRPIDNALNEFRELLLKDNVQKSEIVELLTKYIPNFGHIEKGITLDKKM